VVGAGGALGMLVMLLDPGDLFMLHSAVDLGYLHFLHIFFASINIFVF
jgi:hypothetical protein